MPKTEQYSPLPPWPRTDYCGAIRATDVGREVALWGWVQTRRDHGGLIFIDLRDRDGIVQLVLNPAHAAAAHATGEEIRLKHRYLDLRRPEMQRNLRWRHQALQAVRSHLDQNGFIDVETP